MARLNIELPKELHAKAEARAAETGCGTVESYVRALISADAEGEDFGAPESLHVENQQQLERLVLERLEDPGPSVEVTEEFWEGLKRRIRGTGGEAGK